MWSARNGAGTGPFSILEFVLFYNACTTSSVSFERWESPELAVSIIAYWLDAWLWPHLESMLASVDLHCSAMARIFIICVGTPQILRLFKRSEPFLRVDFLVIGGPWNASGLPEASGGS